MRPDTTHAIRAQLIAAMETRSATLHGEARRLLVARLIALRASCAEASVNAAVTGDACDHAAATRGALGELVDHLGSDASPERTGYPELPALDAFRSLWSALRADSRQQQAVVQPPSDAGPLNSAALASRSIALMRELSPAYLRQFLAYVDDLAWLEQMGSAGAATASRAPEAKKRTRRKRGP